VVYCQGCPWRCPYCHNGHLLEAAASRDDARSAAENASRKPQLNAWGVESARQMDHEIQANGEAQINGEGQAAEQNAITWSEVLDLLRTRRGLLDAVVFSGGEPTAQSALADAMVEVRALGFKVGLHTGGPYPERLRTLLPLIDWVGLDIKALPDDYPQVTGVPGSGEAAWQSLRLLLESGVALEVRTTPMPGLDDDDYLQRLMRQLADAGVTRYALQQAQPGHLLDPSLRERLRPLSRLAHLNNGLPNPFQQFELRAA
jgi:pyruvate formate lyase activating enzyme